MVRLNQLTRNGMRNVDAVPRIVREPIIRHSVPRLAERMHVHHHIQDFLAWIIVFPADKCINVGDVRLRIVLDQRRVTVACAKRSRTSEHNGRAHRSQRESRANFHFLLPLHIQLSSDRDRRPICGQAQSGYPHLHSRGRRLQGDYSTAKVEDHCRVAKKTDYVGHRQREASRITSPNIQKK